MEVTNTPTQLTMKSRFYNRNVDAQFRPITSFEFGTQMTRISWISADVIFFSQRHEGHEGDFGKDSSFGAVVREKNKKSA